MSGRRLAWEPRSAHASSAPSREQSDVRPPAGGGTNRPDRPPTGDVEFVAAAPRSLVTPSAPQTMECLATALPCQHEREAETTFAGR